MNILVMTTIINISAFITSDDIFMNIVSYNFANNYSNIELPGYMYNIRKISMSNGDGGIQQKIIRSIN